MLDQVNEMLRAAVLRTAEGVANFLPGVVGLLVIVLGSLLVALIARGLVLRALRGLEFDRRAEHLGLGAVADWSTVGGPSMLLARVVMWTIVLAGLLVGLSALDAALPEAFARSLLAYIPNVLAAILIVVLGTILARFLAQSVLIGAVNLQLPSARLIGAAVRWVILLLAWVLALEHLGIGRGLLTLAFAIFFGGIVLALSLALGLGSTDLVRRALERQSRDSSETDKLTHV